MGGALEARREDYESRRDLALMTAYFGANLTQADWEKSRIPRLFGDWLRQMTLPQTQADTAVQRIAAWSQLQALGFAVSVNRTEH